jgi:hypothetical protein
MKSLMILCVFSVPLFSSEYSEEYEKVYASISDICHPTFEDFQKIQEYILEGERPYLECLNTFYPDVRNDGLQMGSFMRQTRLISPKNEIDLSLHVDYLGNDPSNKEWCVISYASYNREYDKKLQLMNSRFRKVKFSGHLLYRIGGWPDIEGGSLKLAHVPYAFKVAMFREAQKLGYKKVLWLDTSMDPQKNFDVFFDIIGVDGYFILEIFPSKLRSHGSETMRISLGVTEEENKIIPQVAGGIVGIDFTHENGRKLLEAWYKAAEDLDPFLSPRSDQAALAAIAYKLGLSPTDSLFAICAIYREEIRLNHYFFISY